MNSPRKDIKLIYTWLQMAELKDNENTLAKYIYAINKLAKYMKVEKQVATSLCLATGLSPQELFCFYSLNKRLPQMHEADFIINAGIAVYLVLNEADILPGYVDQHARYIYDEVDLYPRDI